MLNRRRLLTVGALVSAMVLPNTPAFAAASSLSAATWGTNGRVKVILPVGGKNVIGGDFTAVTDSTGHTYPAARLAVIDASTGALDLGWAASADGTVSALAVQGSSLYVGGSFTTVDGTGHPGVAALDLATGALLPSFSTTTTGSVDAIATAGASVILGGSFTSLADAGRTTARKFLARVDATSGIVDQTWIPKLDKRVRALQVTPGAGSIYVGGDFTTVNGTSQRSTAVLTASAPGSPVAGYKGAATNELAYSPVFDLELVGPTLYVAAAGGGGACTALDATTGARVWTKHTTGDVQAVAYNHGVVYCGGHFGGVGAFGGLTRYKIAGVQAAAPYATTAFAPRFNSGLGIWALAADAGHLFASGDFTKVDRADRLHYASFADLP